MIQQLESTLRAGAVPQAPQFRATTLAQSSQNISTEKSSSAFGPQDTGFQDGEAATKTKQSDHKVSKDESPDNRGVVGDTLGSARTKVQDEISAEFASIMATGTLRASEAAALATRRVMQRYGHVDVAQG